MGKSKWGGTRGYLQGKIANDVYSIGKDGKGRKQQVVRSLAETVANPQTTAQMRGRMIMSTVMQAMKAMQVIVDHSFDGYPAGQPCLSQFISRNYELIKADVAAHPASGNKFGLNKYQEKGIKIGQYIVADGRAQWPAGAYVNDGSVGVSMAIPSDGATVGDWLDAFGWGPEDYITVVGLDGATFKYCRFQLKENVNRAASLATASGDDIFDTEGSPYGAVSEISGTGTKGFGFQLYDNDSMPLTIGTAILTKKVGSTFRHSKATFVIGSATPAFTADVALPTYPTGTEQFLNGGDI